MELSEKDKKFIKCGQVSIRPCMITGIFFIVLAIVLYITCKPNIPCRTVLVVLLGGAVFINMALSNSRWCKIVNKLIKD